jgi:hypothetical protein
MWLGRLGVTGSTPFEPANNDVLPFRNVWEIELKFELLEDTGGGSEEGVFGSFLFTVKGVITAVGLEIFGFPPLLDPVILLANFRKGDIDRESVPPPLSDPFSLPPPRCSLEPLGGVARYPDVLEPASLSEASAATRIFRAFSISVSVRAIRSFSAFHRWADSE